MKKEYISPDFTILSVRLLDEVLLHSPFEREGMNRNWDWNDSYDYLDDLGEYDDFW